MQYKHFNLLLILPLLLFTGAFLIIPLIRLSVEAGSGAIGLNAFLAMVTESRYRDSMIATFVLAVLTTSVTLILATIAAQTLANRQFFGRGLLLSMLTFPLAFPGVVVGFLMILLGGRLGFISMVSKSVGGPNIVFAYSVFGLFLGYIYFSLPRTLLTLIAAFEKLDQSLIEAARSLGAGPIAIQRDIIIPALFPALYTGGALCFATAMGAFGTAFTLATRFDVAPLLIYTEFTLATNASMAAALSITLGVITWLALIVARSHAFKNTKGTKK